MSSSEAAPESAGSDLATSERALLCDLFDELGPQAPTLCDGWDTRHLAAHLVLREGNPLTMLTAALPSTSAAAIDDLVAESDFGALVSRLRAGPTGLSPFALPQVARFTGALEFFVHHEDVRRATLRWTVRDLPEESNDEIWRRLRGFAKVLMRRAPVGVELVRTDPPESVRANKAADMVKVVGPPSELALFAFGRTSAARVGLDGSPSAVAALTAARLGF